VFQMCVSDGKMCFSSSFFTPLPRGPPPGRLKESKSHGRHPSCESKNNGRHDGGGGTLSGNQDTNTWREDAPKAERSIGKAEEMTRGEREDEREWQSISRQILEVQELTRETGGEGKDGEGNAARKTFEEEMGERRRVGAVERR